MRGESSCLRHQQVNLVGAATRKKKAKLTKEIAGFALTLTFASRLLSTSPEGDHLHPEVIKGLVTP